MSEETKTTTRGRKPKVEQNKTDDVTKMMEEMQKQILELQKQLKESNDKVKDSNKEKSDLQQLVEMLQSNNQNEKQLSKKVKVMSLVPNKYNLTTEIGGRGKAFTFDDFGDIVTMKTTELEEILSVQKQRTQAEQGYFYILDKDIVEDQELEDNYKNISDKNTLEKVMNLVSDECVDIFCGLVEDLQISIATKMAEMINNGIRLDRNRLAEISMRADVDIEKIANELIRTNKNKK